MFGRMFPFARIRVRNISDVAVGFGQQCQPGARGDTFARNKRKRLFVKIRFGAFFGRPNQRATGFRFNEKRDPLMLVRPPMRDPLPNDHNRPFNFRRWFVVDPQFAVFVNPGA